MGDHRSDGQLCNIMWPGAREVVFYNDLDQDLDLNGTKNSCISNFHVHFHLISSFFVLVTKEDNTTTNTSGNMHKAAQKPDVGASVVQHKTISHHAEDAGATQEDLGNVVAEESTSQRGGCLHKGVVEAPS